MLLLMFLEQLAKCSMSILSIIAKAMDEQETFCSSPPRSDQRWQIAETSY